MHRSDKTIIVIDDDPSMRNSLAVLLGKSGYNTMTYASAEAFLSNAATLEVHSTCLILDIHLDGMSGIELAKRMARKGNRPPIIFITGNDSDSERQAALQPNCASYLAKPFSAAVLLEAIDRALTN